MKLRNKSVLAFFLIAIIPILAVSLIALNISHRLLRDSIGRNFANIAREQSMSISRILKDRLSQAKIVAESEQIKEAVKKSNLKYAGKSHDEVLDTLYKVDSQWIEAEGQTAIAEELLNSDLSEHLRHLVQDSEGRFGEIFVTDVHGAAVAMSTTLTDYYQADEQWWEYSFNQGKGSEFIDDRGFDESIKAIAVGMVVPIMHEGEVIGILKINNKVQEIINVIESFEEHEEDHTFLMRSQGDIIAVSKGKEHPDISSLEMKIVAGEDAGWVEDVHQGKEKLMSYSPVDARIFRRAPQPGEIRGGSGEKWAPTTWYLFIELDHAKAFAPLNILKSSVFVCIIVTIILSVVLAVLFARPVLAAIKKLQLGAIKVGKGNLEYEVDLNTNDEIGSLAASFNQMTKNLRDANAGRKRSEEVLQRERDNLTNIFDSIEDGVCIVDKGYNVQYINSALLKEFGAVEGRKCYEYFHGRNDVCPWCKNADVLAGKSVHWEWRPEKTGKTYDLIDTPVNNPDGTVSKLEIFRDVTERKRVEEELASESSMRTVLLDNIPNCFALILKKGTREIVASNQAAKEVGAFPGETCYHTCIRRDEPCGFCLAPELWRTNEPKQLEVEYMERYYEGIWVPFTDELYVHYIFDITARKQAEEALKDKTKEMESMLRAVSHDLRSPLVNIDGFSGELAADCEHLTEMLKGVTADEKTKKQIETLAGKHIPDSLSFIRKGTGKMGGLLKGLSHLAKIGSVKLDIQPLDINDLAQQVVDTMKFSTKKSHATIEVQTLPDCLGDEVQINQVFSNLVSNAVKYLDPERPGRIRIWGKVEGDMAQYCVEDNGIGISDYHKPKVFEIFHRVDPKGSASGDGLGLTTIKQIIERHKGRIWLESKEGKGSKFFISLPHH